MMMNIKTLSYFLLVWMLLLVDGKPVEAARLQAIGVTVSDLGNPFFARIGETMETMAERLTGARVKVSVVSSAYDLKRQISQIDDFIAQKVDLIVLTADHPLDIEPVARRARSAGIKMLAVDVTAKGADATITTDNAQAGRIVCEFLANRLQGKGNLVIINGPPVSSVVDRVNGCKQALLHYPRIKILSDTENGGGNRNGGLEKMTNLLTAFPQIDAVFTINDPTAIGAEIAVRQMGLTLIIASIDGSPVVEQRLKDPSSLIAATAAQFPNQMAIRALQMGMQLLEGKQLKNELVLIPSILITSENVSSYQGWTIPR